MERQTTSAPTARAAFLRGTKGARNFLWATMLTSTNVDGRAYPTRMDCPEYKRIPAGIRTPVGDGPAGAGLWLGLAGAVLWVQSSGHAESGAGNGSGDPLQAGYFPWLLHSEFALFFWPHGWGCCCCLRWLPGPVRGWALLADRPMRDRRRRGVRSPVARRRGTRSRCCTASIRQRQRQRMRMRASHRRRRLDRQHPARSPCPPQRRCLLRPRLKLRQPLPVLLTMPVLTTMPELW